MDWGVPSVSIAGPDRGSDTKWRIFPAGMLLFRQAGGKGGSDSGEAARGMLLSGNRGIPARRERTLRECGREGFPVLRSSTRGENMITSENSAAAT